jgi:hypothetical protein
MSGARRPRSNFAATSPPSSQSINWVGCELIWAAANIPALMGAAGTNRRYWFYGAEQSPEKQMDYLLQLPKLTEDQLKTFTQGMQLPEAYQPPPPVVYQPRPASFPSQVRREFNILEHVRPRRKDRRNYWTQCPSCARINRDQSRDNLAIKRDDPRFYKCWAGCTKEEIRAALGHPIPRRRGF